VARPKFRSAFTRTITGDQAIGTGLPTTTPMKDTMKNALIAITFLIAAAGAHAQTSTAAKETAKATSESTKAAAESTKAAVSTEPAKTMHKTKAKVHRAKARHARHEAKDAAKEATK
jgi:hypothetical protein